MVLTGLATVFLVLLTGTGARAHDALESTAPADQSPDPLSRRPSRRPVGARGPVPPGPEASAGLVATPEGRPEGCAIIRVF